MPVWLEVALIVIAWSVPITRFRHIRHSQAWKNDHIAMNIWLATVSFAAMVTFLADSFSEFFDVRTINNLSTLFAYCSVVLTLYFTTSSTLYIMDTPATERIRKGLTVFVIISLAILVVIYIVFISETAQWYDHRFPDTLPEAVFRLTVYVSALVQCVIMFIFTRKQLVQERVILMRFRYIAILMVAIIGGIYLVIKIVLAMSYFYPPMHSRQLWVASEALFLFAALFWVGAFMNNRIYLSTFELIRNLVSWPIYRDLAYLIRRLDRLVEAVAGQEDPPQFRKFIWAADYYLYRALIRIMDGSAMLADYISSENVEKPTWWGGYLQREADQLVTVLQSVPSSDNYIEALSQFRQASRQVQHDPRSWQIRGI